jgi:hypothetical protein
MRGIFTQQQIQLALAIGFVLVLGIAILPLPIFVRFLLYMITGSLPLGLTIRVGERIGGGAVGLPAMTFVAVTILATISNIPSLSFAAGLALLGALLTLVDAQDQPGRWRYAWAGLWIGLAVGLLFAIPHGPVERVALADLWLALGNTLGPILTPLALAGGFVAVQRRNPKGLLLVGMVLLLLPALTLWPVAEHPLLAALPLLCLLAALALRTVVGTLLSPVLMQARMLAMESNNPTLRTLTSGQVSRWYSPALLALGSLLAVAPLLARL